MTPENAIHFLPFVQALAEGGIVEKRDGNGEYKSYPHYNFDGCHSDYRIRPEPEPEKSLAEIGYETWAKEIDKAWPGPVPPWEMLPFWGKAAYETAAQFVITEYERRKSLTSV